MRNWEQVRKEWQDRWEIIRAVLEGRFTDEPLMGTMNQQRPIGGWLRTNDPVGSLARYELAMASGLARRGAGR